MNLAGLFWVPKANLRELIILVMYEQIPLFFYFTVITVGFIQTLYDVGERNTSVELCTQLTDGILEREAIVTFVTVDDSATSIG